ncbi:unnamed protein product [Pneumocystis jirovecii]|uniref:Uncharacterized protein n=1 Tax=Pneumocystis jirovecii TaxID=42068 RepID=L0P8Y4_PNEJI|nr:unnamed protein product [Pneumocystis jirovecii]
MDTLYMGLYQRWKMYREERVSSYFRNENVNEFCPVRDKKLRMYLRDVRCNREMLWSKRRQQDDDVLLDEQKMRSVFFAEEKQRRQCLEKEAMFNQITFEEIYDDSLLMIDALIFIEKMEMLENQGLSYLVEKYFHQELFVFRLL